MRTPALKAFSPALAILLALASGRARAQTPHRAQIDALDSISPLRELPCPSSAPVSGRLVVIFDGMKGFCPRLASTDLPLWNERRTLAEYAREELTPAEWDHFAQLREDEISFLHGCYYVHPVTEALRAVERLPQILYYSKSGYPEARACVRELAARARAGGHPLRLSLTAYSLGAAAAMRLARDWIAEGGVVESMLTVDPVADHQRVINATIGDGDTDFFRRPAGILHWENYYQKLDRSALAVGTRIPFGIRGSRVPGADVDQELRPGKDGRFTEHSTIVWMPEVRSALQRFLPLKPGAQHYP